MKTGLRNRGGWRRLRRIAMGMAVLAVAAGQEAGAAGLLIADGGFGGVLRMKEHAVKVVINNGVAVTRVTQVFENAEPRQVEALYTFPVPKGASVANFSMWINGQEMVGEVVEKERAREIYNSYKKRKRDPGLLEQVDYKTFEMRIFPIAPHAEQKVEVTYYQELDVDNDWASYVYPLATVTRQGIDERVEGRFALDVEVKSAVPIATTESPSHPDGFVFAQHDETYVQASLEAQNGSLARDVVLAYHLSRPKTGIDLITSRTRGEDGYFQLTLTAGEDLAELDKGMDYVFLVDVSGSMANDGKLVLSKESVAAFVDALSEEDRFELLTFNVRTESAFNALRAADAGAREEAMGFLASQRAKGGTELKPALDVAYKYGDPDRPLNVVILSDGMTEQRERVALLSLIQGRPSGARVFCIGVGNEVNRPLLSQLAEDSGGLAAFVSAGDDFTRQARAFRRKLMRPAVSDPVIDFGGRRVYDLEPPVLPNLYHGAPVRVYGRYRGEGPVRVTMRGDVQGVAISQRADLEMPAVDPGNPEIERMWAWHRVDRLQKEGDRRGSRSAVVDEIVQLGEAYSIVTEYTSFLVLENNAEYQRWQIDRRNVDRLKRDRRALEARRTELDMLRDKAATDLGPAAVAAAPATPARMVPSGQRFGAAPTTPSADARVPRVDRSPGRSFDFDIGTGPVGPLFLLLAGLIAGRRRRAA